MKLALIGIAFFAIPAIVHANGPVEEAAASEAARNSDKEGGANAYICKRMPPPVGTRLGARQICKTRGEWVRLEREAQNDLRKLQSLRARDNVGRGFNGVE